MAERFAAQRGDVDGCVRMCAVGVRRYSLAFQNPRTGSFPDRTRLWHGPEPPVHGAGGSAGQTILT